MESENTRLRRAVAEMKEYGLLERLLGEQCHVDRHRDDRPGADDDDAEEGKVPIALKEPKEVRSSSMHDAARPGGDLQRTQGEWVATMVRTIYQQPSPDEVHAQLDRVTDQLQDRFPQMASLLDEAGPDILAFSSFPVPHWKKIWSNNPLERFNKEIRRRTDVVGIFP